MSTESFPKASRQPISLNCAARYGAACSVAASAQTARKAGLSIEEAARLSGMEVSEWAAIEDGYAPQTTAQLQSIAGTLEISYDRLLNLVLLCRQAWEL